MNTELLLRAAGLLLFGLAGLNLYLPRHFKWRRELEAVSPFTRQVFFVHAFCIMLVLGLQGGLLLFLPAALLERSPLAAAVLAGLTLFWGVRLGFQFFVYDPALWRGKPFYTLLHILFALLWLFFTGVCGWALYLQVG